MSDIIQLNENQADALLSRCGIPNDSKESIKRSWRISGFLTKSALEKARYNYYTIDNTATAAEKYIKELEKALEEKE